MKYYVLAHKGRIKKVICNGIILDKIFPIENVSFPFEACLENACRTKRVLSEEQGADFILENYHLYERPAK